jgi:hypothetical protein
MPGRFVAACVMFVLLRGITSLELSSAMPLPMRLLRWSGNDR